MTREVHLLQLVHTLRAVRAALNISFGEAKAAALLHNGLKARCIQCGIDLTPEELSWMAPQADEAGVCRNPRLQRLLKGYCARRTCDSYFYEVSLTHPPELDLEALWNTAADSVAGQALTRDEEPGGSSFLPGLLALRKNREAMLIVGLAAAIGFLAWWNLRTPSWAKRPSSYRISADPVQTVPGR